MMRIALGRGGVAVFLVGPVLLLILLGAQLHAERSAASAPQQLLLPEAGGLAPPIEGLSLAASQKLLQRDTNIPCSYARTWKAGDQLGIVLRASDLQYPLQVRSVVCYLYNFLSSPQTLSLRAHVHAWVDGRPGTLLASSPSLTFSLAPSDTLWANLPLPEAVALPSPQPFFAVVQYVDGAEGLTPSVVSDLSTEIPQGLCYYRTATGVWREHYAFWPEASEVGFSMIRAWVTTSGGPEDETIIEPEADAFIAERFPSYAFGKQEYLLVGEEPFLGHTRALLRFPQPQAPVAGATPIAATLRLFCYSEISRSVPLTVTVYRSIGNWDESSASWDKHAMSYAERYGVGRIPAQRPHPTPTRNYFLSLDVSGLVQKWLQGTPNDGLMLVGNEGTPSNAKRLFARELASGSERRPRLIVKWALPAPTETALASPTATPRPHEPTSTATLTPTASATPQDTPSPTARATLGTPTASPTLGPLHRLHVPLISKA